LSFPAFFDTCTLFGAAITDLLMELADQGAFRPLWSAHVLAELEGAVTRAGVPQDAIQKRIRAMQSAFPDADVTGYENLIGEMTNDDGDRHVVAAAVRANAEIIVTFNLKHFPEEALSRYDLEAVHPDAFLLDQLDLYPRMTLMAVDDIAAAYENPPMTTEQFLERLARAGVPHFAARVLAEL
jgi:predicted nucleic acid-binding protein